uniref:DUF4201 domain-containing protein n=1 Tax=Rhabditophanes sp. KR3021 TaxID=114890 RepID=A0AC35UC28_9BILA
MSTTRNLALSTTQELDKSLDELLGDDRYLELRVRRNLAQCDLSGSEVSAKLINLPDLQKENKNGMNEDAVKSHLVIVNQFCIKRNNYLNAVRLSHQKQNRVLELSTIDGKLKELNTWRDAKMLELNQLLRKGNVSNANKERCHAEINGLLENMKVIDQNLARLQNKQAKRRGIQKDVITSAFKDMKRNFDKELLGLQRHFQSKMSTNEAPKKRLFANLNSSGNASNKRGLDNKPTVSVNEIMDERFGSPNGLLSDTIADYYLDDEPGAHVTPRETADESILLQFANFALTSANRSARNSLNGTFDELPKLDTTSGSEKYNTKMPNLSRSLNNSVGSRISIDNSLNESNLSDVFKLDMSDCDEFKDVNNIFGDISMDSNSSKTFKKDDEEELISCVINDESISLAKDSHDDECVFLDEDATSFVIELFASRLWPLYTENDIPNIDTISLRLANEVDELTETKLYAEMCRYLCAEWIKKKYDFNNFEMFHHKLRAEIEKIQDCK